MRQKRAWGVAGVVLCTGLFLGAWSATAAPCREDCHKSCCGSDDLCRGEDEMKCLAECLKGCGGDDVPPVSPPAPVPDKKKSEEPKEG